MKALRGGPSSVSITSTELLRAIPEGFHFIVRSRDMRLLPYEDFPNGALGVRIFQGFLIGLVCCVLALFRRLQQGVIPAAEMRLDIAPRTMDSTGSGAADILGYSCGVLQFMLE